MFFGLVTLFVALSISAVAAYYSIVGLMAIFSAAAFSIAVMGVVLEIGKLVTASWLYQNWKTVPKVLKYYLTSAVVILMFITSMGIFGYLSKSHIDAGTNTSQVTVKLDRVNSRIASEQKVIDRAERQLENLDKALERYVELGAVSKGLDRRESQEEERLKLTNMVNKSQEKIDEYLDQKSEYELEIKNFEVEVGPLKYISALLYGDDALTFLENAVRWVILILVFVFDPLAVLLVVAANITIRDVLNKRKRIKDKLLRKQRKNKILVKEEPIGDGTARKITKTKNGVTMEYYE
jgi:hypothetical protein|tara:strand:+ start:1118 stop:1999 length:882 start_codon:yes stop_codon:yes gene_type:complete